MSQNSNCLPLRSQELPSHRKWLVCSNNRSWSNIIPIIAIPSHTLATNNSEWSVLQPQTKIRNFFFSPWGSRHLTVAVVLDSINVLRAGSLHNPPDVAPWPAGANLIGGGVTVETWEGLKKKKRKEEIFHLSCHFLTSQQCRGEKSVLTVGVQIWKWRVSP